MLNPFIYNSAMFICTRTESYNLSSTTHDNHSHTDFTLLCGNAPVKVIRKIFVWLRFIMWHVNETFILHWSNGDDTELNNAIMIRRPTTQWKYRQIIELSVNVHASFCHIIKKGLKFFWSDVRAACKEQSCVRTPSAASAALSNTDDTLGISLGRNML